MIWLKEEGIKNTRKQYVAVDVNLMVQNVTPVKNDKLQFECKIPTENSTCGENYF